MLSTLLEMSLAGGCIILVIIVLRALLLHRLPKTLFFWLWMVALARLLLPVFPASPLSVFARWEAPAAPVLEMAMVPEQESTQVTPPASASAVGDMTQAAPPAVQKTAQSVPSSTPQSASVATLQSAPVARATVFTGVWLGVSALLLLFLGLTYARGLRRFRTSRPIDHPCIRAWLQRHALRRPLAVRLCAAIDTPMTYGVLRPVILLPPGMELTNTQALLCVLDHELSHIRHFDAIWKLLIAVAACLHWFNPLVWAMAILANRDIELCCDARVLHRHRREDRRAYASALLRMEEARAHALPLTSAFSRNAMEERIGAIMNRKKISLLAIALVLLVAAAALVAFSAAPEERAVSEAGTQGTQADESELSITAAPQETLPPQELTWTEGSSAMEGAEIYAPYGLDIAENSVVSYQGHGVRFLLDETGNRGFNNLSGEIDVYAMRDESGALTGLRACTKEEFEQNTAAAWVNGTIGWNATIEEANEAWWETRAQRKVESQLQEDRQIVEEYLRRQLYATYEPYDMAYIYNAIPTRLGMICYRGLPVRYFLDEGAGETFFDADGCVDIYAQRDKNGALTGLRVATPEEFHQRTEAEADTYDSWGIDIRQTEFAYREPPEVWPTAGTQALLECMDVYAPLGVTVVAGVPLYWDTPIRFFTDEEAGIDQICFARGCIDVYAVYDGAGNLTGLRPSTQEEFAQQTNRSQAELSGEYASAALANYAFCWDFAYDAEARERLEPYTEFGLSYHNGFLYYQTRRVRQFIDGERYHYDDHTGTVDIYPVRDENGNLTGVREATLEEFLNNSRTSDDW